MDAQTLLRDGGHHHASIDTYDIAMMAQCYCVREVFILADHCWAAPMHTSGGNTFITPREANKHTT